MKTTRKRPASARVLTQWVDGYAREHGQPPARIRNWVSHMVIGGALERGGFDGAGRKFTIKGGVALEMRLRNLARATKDLDLILMSDDSDPVEALAVALSQSYEGFSFRLRGEPWVMSNGASRVEVSLDYVGKSWGTIQVDVSRKEGSGTEVDMVEAIPLAHFGLDGPQSLPCLSLPYHVAQKIHGVTLPPPPGRRNDRFRDLVDLLLLREWITDFGVVQRACRDVFKTRGTHAWPPFFTPPAHWDEPFTAMAADLRLQAIDLQQAVFEVRAFINEIDDSADFFRPIEITKHLSAATWFFVVTEDDEVWRIPAESGEAMYMADLPLEKEVPADWQREPGGVALIGVVLLLQNRRPRYVVRTATRALALSENLVGKEVAFAPPAWRSLASVILREAKLPERAVSALAAFSQNAQGPLPCSVATRARLSTRETHKYFAPPFLPNETPLWDLSLSEPVYVAVRDNPIADAA